MTNYFSEQILLQPLVARSTKQARHLYLKLKHVNSVSRRAFSLIELVMAKMLTLCMLVFKRFQPQFTYADQLVGNAWHLGQVYSTLIWPVIVGMYERARLLWSKPLSYASLVYAACVLLCMRVVAWALNIVERQVEKHLLLKRLAEEPLQRHVVLYKRFKEARAPEFDAYTLAEKARLLTLIVADWLRVSFSEIVQWTKETCVYKLAEERLVKRSSLLSSRFSLTKEKIDLYKEYLDVLTKQFTVQDGRSLDNVQVNQQKRI